jgi:hypothetical protein
MSWLNPPWPRPASGTRGRDLDRNRTHSKQNPSRALRARCEALEDRALLALPTLSIADAAALEGASGTRTLAFIVRLSAPSTKNVTVAYSTANQTAAAGSDYNAASGTLTFSAGQTQRSISVTIRGDTTYEPDETFRVSLSNPTNATIADGTGIGTIRNDDSAPLPSISISDVSVHEGDSGSTTASVSVTLGTASTSTITVNYATGGGTATAGSDYLAATGTLSFAPGQTLRSITITIQSDVLDEANETLNVTLSSPSGATILDTQGVVTILDNDEPTPAGQFNYGEALQKSLFFYEAQRAGDLPSDNSVEWRGDAALSDGSDVGVDLIGGFWDAGDHVKFGLPMAGSMTLLAWGLVEYRDAYEQSGQLERMLGLVEWGADYLVKSHTAPNEFWGQVGRGDLDHSYWGAPEVMTMPRPAFKIDEERPGSDLAGEAAAALAAASIVFSVSDPVYAAQLRQHAIELYAFANTYRGKYSDSIPDAANYYNSYSGYTDELVWGAVWLYKATGNAIYLQQAQTLYAQNFAGQAMTWTHSWDDKRYGAAVILAQLTGGAGYKQDAERWLDYWSVGTSGGTTRVSYTPGGLAWLNGWGSLRYASTTAFLALVYADTVRDFSGRYHDFALGQIDYILGDNPRNASYVVGFGTNPPQFPHHRAASGVWDGNVANPTPNRHILYGALVGGPESPDDFNYHDVRSNYISNEVALDYNAGFTGALARLYREYGGEPLANFPQPETRDLEYFVEASINQQSSTFTEIRALLNNRSAWPARASSNLSFRYFVNLSETYLAGYSAGDIQVNSFYSQGATISPLRAWDAPNRIYYVDVSFAGVDIRPTAGQFAKEAQLRVGLRSGVPASAWDPSNDWSYLGLLVGQSQIRPTAKIPVYEGTTLRYGETPGVLEPGTPAISVGNASITEGNTGQSTLSFTVTLSVPSTQTVTVTYETANGTAAAGSDYAATSGSLTFAPGVTSRSATVTILGDTSAESNETFAFRLSNPINAVIATSQATGTILDDDAPASGYTVTYTVRDDWGAGFVADVVIMNTGTSTITDWVLEFDLPVAISNIWNGAIESRVGNRYRVRAASWNNAIAPGQSVSFGFQASPGNTPRTLSYVRLFGNGI